MKKLLFFISFLALVTACNNDDNSLPEGRTPESTTLEFSENAFIEISQQSNDIVVANVAAGELLVFEYFFVAEQADIIADDEYAERIIFEIDPNLTSFSFADDELASVRPFFNRFCFCSFVGSLLITSGNISGTKVNDTAWDIDINVNFTIDDQEVTKTISGRFELKTS